MSRFGARSMLIAIVFLLAWAVAGISGAEQLHVEARQARAHPMETPPVLDGVVDEAEWQAMEPLADFIQQEPFEGQPATEKTEIRIGFDAQNLYFGIICLDSEPDHIVVTQNRRDGTLTDTDSILILLDTFHDHQNAFIFGTSPTGIEYDGQVSKAGQGRGGAGMPARAGGQGSRGGAQRGGSSAFNLNWDGVWRVRSQVTPRGWESEIVIPFKTLRYKPGINGVWGVNVVRNLRRRNEQSFWSPISRAFEFTQVELAGHLHDLTTKPHRSIKLLPYVAGGLKQDFTRADDQSQFARATGLDVKYSLTSSLTLDATFNTDFAQVEVDEEQVNLTRFDLFFPEKRPFFLENSGFFEFGTPREVEVFFSRRIGIDDSGAEIPIDAGARVSGKAGKYQLGFLNMLTSEVDGTAPANNFSVLRLSRELPNRSSVGLIGANRESVTHSADTAPYNRTFGADANIGLGRHANWFNYAAKSDTPGLNGRSHAYSSSFEYDDERHRVDASFLEVGEDFNPEAGFVRRTGYRKPNFGYRFTRYPEGRYLRSWAPHFQVNRWYTLSTNKLESAFDHYHFDTRWQNGSRLGLAVNRNFERLDAPFEIHPDVFITPGGYGFSEIVLNYMTDPSAALFADGNLSVGNFYGGTIRTINFNGGYRYGSNLTWSGGYLRNSIDLPEGEFTTELMGFRFNWSFTPKSYLQAFIQYNSTTRQVGSNIRFALLSTSSTGLFVVYNTRTLTEPYLDPHEIRRHTQARMLYLKFNYLFDF